eukprot:c13889_g1_i2 orf=332-1306(-)
MASFVFSIPFRNSHHRLLTSQQWIDASLLWLAGFKDACCFHRAVIFCTRSRRVLVKTGQCFILNGCIFLGSIVFLQKVVIPILHWLLVTQCRSSYSLDCMEGIESRAGERFLSLLQTLLVYVYYVFWLYPLYIISFAINYIWYNEIAQEAFEMIKENHDKSAPQSRQNLQKSLKPTENGIMRIIFGLGEQIYSVIMLTVFFIEVSVISCIPYIGQFLNFFLLSWLYAYYCFDYKWGFARWSLERRLIFFESNWAFFAGFGSPYVLATSFFSPFIRCGVVAILFPLFVLVATASHPEFVVASCLRSRESSLERLPIFHTANALTL